MMQVSQSQPYQVINSPCQVKHSLEADDKELLSLGLDELSDLLAVKKQNLEDLQVHCKKQIQELVIKNQFSGKPEGMANNAQTLEPVRKKERFVLCAL